MTTCPHCQKEITITPAEAAQILRGKPSEKRSQASRDNGRKRVSKKLVETTNQKKSEVPEKDKK